MTDSAAVSVVVPVLNAEKYIVPLLEVISSQEPLVPREVILVDSRSTDGTRRLADPFPFVKFITIEHFSHGRARNLGARASKGDFVVYLSQDALPVGVDWLANLLGPFQDPGVGAVYSRQVPYESANPMERFFLSTRFPPGDVLVREAKKDGDLSLEDVFFSNVSSAARREVLLEHPFDEELIMSEDQKFSLDLLAAGWKVAYQPMSVVVHSHDYSLKHVFQRYFDSVYSLTQIFRGHGIGTTLSMGGSYSFRELAYVTSKHPRTLPYYCLYFSAKTAGTLAGHVADRIPLSLRGKLSLHSYHWEKRS